MSQKFTILNHQPPPTIEPPPQDPLLTVGWCPQLQAHAPHIFSGLDEATLTRDDLSAFLEHEPIRICGGLNSNLPLVPVIDRKPHLSRAVCEVCATWICKNCGHDIQRANRSPRFVHTCTRCGEHEGKYYAVRHLEPVEHFSPWLPW